LDVEYRIRKY